MALSRIIEIFGLPGSGKTTLASEIVQSLSSGPHMVYQRSVALADNKPVYMRHLARGRYVIGSFPRRPRMFMAAVRVIREDKQPTFRSFLKVCWNMWCVLGWYGWLDRNSKGIAVVDQGILQAIWSVRLTALDNKADWLGFLKRFDIIDGVVTVECDPTLLPDRIKARSDRLSRLDGVTSNSALWISGLDNYARGKREAAEIAPVLQVTNETSFDRQKAVPDVVDWIGGIP